MSNLASFKMADPFEWPWQYSFPPFYTLQPNLDTRKKQLEAWCDLILSYYKYKKVYMLDVTEAMSSELFYNKNIDRKLSNDALDSILEVLSQKGNLEWEDKKRQRCHVMWRKPEEWAALIYKWIQDSSMTDTVCTLYELMSGDDTVQQEFHGIDTWMMKKALSVLESKGKAQMFEAPDSTDESGLGVKFYN